MSFKDGLMKDIITALLVVLLLGCSDGKWEGFVYPNANDLTVSKNIGKFSSLEACRDKALSELATTSILTGDYECGLNCKSRSDLGGIKVCEQTEK